MDEHLVTLSPPDAGGLMSLWQGETRVNVTGLPRYATSPDFQASFDINWARLQLTGTFAATQTTSDCSPPYIRGTLLVWTHDVLPNGIGPT